MKINPLFATLLALPPSSVAASDIMTTQLPKEHASAVNKVVAALCSKTKGSDKAYEVKLGPDSHYCDEESTGLAANAAMAGVEESLVAARKKNRLAVAARKKNRLAVGAGWDEDKPAEKPAGADANAADAAGADANAADAAGADAG